MNSPRTKSFRPAATSRAGTTGRRYLGRLNGDSTADTKLARWGAPAPLYGFHTGRSPLRNWSRFHSSHGCIWTTGSVRRVLPNS